MQLNKGDVSHETQSTQPTQQTINTSKHIHNSHKYLVILYNCNHCGLYYRKGGAVMLDELKPTPTELKGIIICIVVAAVSLAIMAYNLYT